MSVAARRGRGKTKERTFVFELGRFEGFREDVGRIFGRGVMCGCDEPCGTIVSSLDEVAGTS